MMETNSSKAASGDLLQRATVAGLSGGSTQQYFLDAGSDEADMRERLAVFREQMRSPMPETQSNAATLLRRVATVYKVQYFKKEFDRPASDFIVQSVAALGWWKTEAPALLGASDDVSSSIAEVVPRILRGFQTVGARREFSLVTKFLHFCFPDTFVIFDNQAAKSINQWASFAFREEPSVPRRFDTTVMADSSGGGYAGLLEFYQRLWRDSSDVQRAEASRVAKELESQLRDRFGKGRLRISVIDLVDKLLWKANANPIHLGLAR